jgi:hypothetical protein
MDSAASPKSTAVSPPVPAPKPPEINGVSFNRLTATVEVLLPSTDVDGIPLAGPITNIKVAWKAIGQEGGEKNVPGTFSPGQEYKVDIEVPAWNTSYDFEAVVTV